MISRLRSKRRTARRGNAMVHALVASAILAMTLAGVTSMWYVAFNLTAQADDVGLAYDIARHRIEDVKQEGYNAAGFQLAADVTQTNNYDDQGNDTTNSDDNHIYQTQTVLSTTNGLQTVTVSVTGPHSANVLYQSSTYLVKAGI